MTSIEWTDATWNPVTGCSKVSPGCAHCYAEREATGRLKGSKGYPGLPWTPENAMTNVVLHPDRLDQPLHWRKPRMVFVNSMSDLFHELVDFDFITRVFLVMAEANQHVFQVLTKRPERILDWMRDAWWHPASEGRGGSVVGELAPLPPNIWLGTSIENRRFVHRADFLRKVPAAVRFISAEPLLGSLATPEWKPQDYPIREGRPHGVVQTMYQPALDLTGIDWLIVGGESGRHCRKTDLQWARELRDAASSTNTAFFMKQLGGYRPGSELEDLPEDLRIREWPERRTAVAA